MTMKADKACTHENGDCASLPELVRMNYFHGQLISERDLRTEQDYLRARLAHMNRCLHGYGVLCGLEVRPVPRGEDCRPEDDDERQSLRGKIAALEKQIAAVRDEAKAEGADLQAIAERLKALETEREALLRQLEKNPPKKPHDDDNGPRRPPHLVEVTCGAAIDCEGNDIILRRPVTVDLTALLKASERDHLVAHEPRTVYLSICYQECGREPTRPFELDDCATSVRCHDARVAEGARLTVSLDPPAEDTRCGSCCTPCEECCLLLAAIRVEADEPIGAGDIDLSVRRRFGLYEATVIDGIGWRHGHTYGAGVANALLGTNDSNGGLEIRFSRPVRVATLQPGVIDLWRVTGGRGISGVIASMEAEYVGLPADPDEMVDKIRIRNASGERMQPKDRVLIIVRGAFILDACCRPVDGAHIGGRVPRIPPDDEAGKSALDEEQKDEAPAFCAHPPHGPVPWTTGAGGNFESWFHISEA
jgi:hypothetical protein